MLGYFEYPYPRADITIYHGEAEAIASFIFDTGFDGELAMSASLARRFGGVAAGAKSIQLADGTIISVDYMELSIEWDDEPRLVEVLILNGENPLIGVRLMHGFQICMEMVRDGIIDMQST
jgi:clan AA aspartic protease